MTSVRIYTKPIVEDYEVVVEAGALDHLDQQVRRVAPAHAYAVIADSTVAALYGDRARRALERTGATVHALQFPAGEPNKTVATWASLSERLTAEGLSRDCCVVSLGGGVTTDMAGFVAATFMRGVPVVHVPTTLLAMIDAAIGGKTGVDTAAGKNLLGAFHQPRAVVVDPHLLRTLPEAELGFGLAEAIKHGAIADADYVDWIESSIASIRQHKTHTLASLISRSVEIKAHFASEDVHEQGARAALNFGHTIAHALEQATAYELAHGEAVALGMIAEATAGEQLGITGQGTADRLSAALIAAGLPIRRTQALDREAVLAATRSDKKTRAGAQHFTLLARVGEVARHAGAWTMAVPDDVVREALTSICLAT